MEIPLIDPVLITWFDEPGLMARFGSLWTSIALALAAFFAFVGLTRRVVRAILRRAKGISVISNPPSSVFFTDDSCTDEESVSGSDSESESESESCSEEEESDKEEGSSGVLYGDGRGRKSNFEPWWGGAVVKTWEGLGSSIARPFLIDDETDGDGDGDGDIPVVRFWDESTNTMPIPVRRRWGLRSFVTVD